MRVPPARLPLTWAEEGVVCDVAAGAAVRVLGAARAAARVEGLGSGGRRDGAEAADAGEGVSCVCVGGGQSVLH